MKKADAFAELGKEIFKMHGITDYTCNGECSCCGECCSNLLPLSETEIKRIHKYIKTFNIKPIKRSYPVASEMLYDGICPFRNGEKKICEIYRMRPLICKIFRCNAFPTIQEGKMLRKEKRKVIDMRKEFFSDGI